MMTALSLRIWTPIFMGLTLLLAACSAPVTVAPVQSAPIINGKVTRGVIAAVRPVTGQNSNQAGLNGVFAALNAPVPSAPVSATEYVVQRSDDTTVSIVTQTGSFSIGDRVEIVDGAQAELIHGD